MNLDHYVIQPVGQDFSGHRYAQLTGVVNKYLNTSQ